MSAKKPPEAKIGSVAPFGLRMLPELKARIERAAAESGRSLNAEIVHRLQGSLDDDAGSKLPPRDAAPNEWLAWIEGSISQMRLAAEAMRQAMRDREDEKIDPATRQILRRRRSLPQDDQ